MRLTRRDKWIVYMNDTLRLTQKNWQFVSVDEADWLLTFFSEYRDNASWRDEIEKDRNSNYLKLVATYKEYLRVKLGVTQPCNHKVVVNFSTSYTTYKTYSKWNEN